MAELLGKQLERGIGVSACPRTATASQVASLGERGLDVITYKTVRSSEWAGHDDPRRAIVDAKGYSDRWPTATVKAFIPDGGFDLPAGVSTANSYGVPSLAPEVWQLDVARAIELLERLPNEIVFIVSVMGSPELHDGADLVQDFVHTAMLAQDAGAQVIELNLSCPNTAAKDGTWGEPIFKSPGTVERIAYAVAAALQSEVKIVAKIGFGARSAGTYKSIWPYVNAIAAINTLPVPVKMPDGGDAFPGRPTAGLSGAFLADTAREETRVLAQTYRERLFGGDVDIISIGGVDSMAEVEQRFSDGANAVQFATVSPEVILGDG